MGTLKTSSKTQAPERQRPWLQRGIRALLWLLALSVWITFYGRWHLENRGLPFWIKERIIAQLAEKGWDVSFASMRWLPDEGLVIEDSRIVLQGKTPGTVTAEAMALNIQPWAWLTSTFELDHALLKNGRFEMPLGEDEAAPWVIDGITSRIQLHSRDWWELDFLEAQAFGGLSWPPLADFGLTWRRLACLGLSWPHLAWLRALLSLAVGVLTLRSYAPWRCFLTVSYTHLTLPTKAEG